MLKIDKKLRDLLVVLLKTFRSDEMSLELTVKGAISALNELEEVTSEVIKTDDNSKEPEVSAE